MSRINPKSEKRFRRRTPRLHTPQLSHGQLVGQRELAPSISNDNDRHIGEHNVFRKVFGREGAQQAVNWE